jgi:periplasmic copper chaperone A
MHATRRTLITALLSLTTAAAAQTQAAPKVEAAWARPTVNGQAGGGGFLKITGTTQPDRLLSISAKVSKAVELHSMEMEGNIMRMRQIDAIDIPAGKTIELKPGGLHVMFVGLTQTLKNGATIPLTLKFEKGGEVKVDMKVMNPAGVAAMQDMQKP